MRGLFQTCCAWSYRQTMVFPWTTNIISIQCSLTSLALSPIIVVSLVKRNIYLSSKWSEKLNAKLLIFISFIKISLTWIIQWNGSKGEFMLEEPTGKRYSERRRQELNPTLKFRYTDIPFINCDLGSDTHNSKPLFSQLWK